MHASVRLSHLACAVVSFVFVNLLFAPQPACCADTRSVVVTADVECIDPKIKAEKRIAVLTEKLLAKKLNATKVFEVQDRSPETIAEAKATGKKLKAALEIIVVTVNLWPAKGFSMPKPEATEAELKNFEVLIDVSARASKTADGQILGAWSAKEKSTGILPLSTKDSDWTDDGFQKTKIGEVLNTVLDKLSTDMAK